ncbi:MAG: hypothetical protein PHH11_04865 [Methylomonas sp.]|nr:hypothetical protein [Methylomonas sp.]
MTYEQYLELYIKALAFIVAAGTLLKGLVEYRKQGLTKRAEVFLQMRTRLRQDESFSKLCDLLEVDSPELQDIPLVERDRFIGFFEELALMHNSGLINKQVTLYMFGYFAIRCYHSENFWTGLNKDQPLWSLFMDFAKEMDRAHNEFRYDKRQFCL